MENIKNDLIKAQREYIQLLDKECSRLGSIFFVKPYLQPKQKDIDLGKQMRERICELENKLVNIK